MLLRLPNGLTVESVLTRKKFPKWQDAHPEFPRIVFQGKQAVQTLRRKALDSGKCANSVQPLSYIKKERRIKRFNALL